MGELRVGFSRLAPIAAGLCVAASLLALCSSPAEARSRRHHQRYAHLPRLTRVATGVPSEVEASKYSAIVVDANTGRELWGVNENALRHPASLTKVMTLYLLFEKLQEGSLTLASRIPMSEHAAGQEPSKLGVEPGDSISVEEAIKAVVTRSANDVAVAIGEKIGGSEPAFAALMTHKAHELGMSRTLYRDASGLPNDEQLTTAHDLALLGMAMQQQFPQYFRYFSVREFVYQGQVIGSHDHLLGRVEGVDGIKTGYTQGSGFNLLTSLHRDGRALVAVVMGGRSGPLRDHLMERLIETHIAAASTERTATRLAIAPAPGREALAEAETPPERLADAEPAGRAAEGDGDDADVEAPPPRVLATPRALARPAKPASPLLAKAAALDASKLGWRSGPRGKVAQAARKPHEGETRIARADEGPKSRGWSVQVGASDDPDEAHDMLVKARRNHTLAAARGFTEKVKAHGDTLYRVRFAGLDSVSAQKACRDLKHGGLDCYTTRE